MRTLIDIPDDRIDSLDLLARQNGRSRAAEIRAAIERHLQDQSSNDWIGRGAGYWEDRKDIGDGLDYQRRIREDRDPA